MHDLEVIRFLAMDIITENNLPCFSPREKPYFTPSITDKSLSPQTYLPRRVFQSKMKKAWDLPL